MALGRHSPLSIQQKTHLFFYSLLRFPHTWINLSFYPNLHIKLSCQLQLKYKPSNLSLDDDKKAILNSSVGCRFPLLPTS